MRLITKTAIISAALSALPFFTGMVYSVPGFVASWLIWTLIIFAIGKGIRKVRGSGE